MPTSPRTARLGRARVNVTRLISEPECRDVVFETKRHWWRAAVQTGGFGSRMGFSRSRAGEHRIWTLRLGQQYGPAQLTFHVQHRRARVNVTRRGVAR